MKVVLGFIYLMVVLSLLLASGLLVVSPQSGQEFSVIPLLLFGPVALVSLVGIMARAVAWWERPWSLRPASTEDAAALKFEAGQLAALNFSSAGTFWVRRSTRSETLIQLHHDGRGTWASHSPGAGIHFDSYFDGGRIGLTTSNRMALRYSATYVHTAGGSLEDLLAKHRLNVGTLQAHGHTLSDRPSLTLTQSHVQHRIAELGGYAWLVAFRSLVPSWSTLRPLGKRKEFKKGGTGLVFVGHSPKA